MQIEVSVMNKLTNKSIIEELLQRRNTPCSCCKTIVKSGLSKCIICVMCCSGEVCRKEIIPVDYLKERQLDLNGNKKSIFHL